MKRFISLLLVLTFALCAFQALSISVGALSPLPGFVAFNDTVMWSHVPGASRYYILGMSNGSAVALRNESFTNFDSKVWGENGVTFYIQKYMDAVGTFDEGIYTLTFEALDADGERMGYESTLVYNYRSAVPKLETPKNLSWNGRTICWDPVDGRAHYLVCVYSEPGRVAVWSGKTENSCVDLSGSGPNSSGDPVDFRNDMQYYFTVYAVPKRGEARESDEAESLRVSGKDVKEGLSFTTTEHRITVIGAAADVISAPIGKTVGIIAEQRENYKFWQWKVLSGNVSIAAREKWKTSFVMGNEDVKIQAEYRYTGTYLYSFDVYVTDPAGGGHPEAPAVLTDAYRITDYEWTDKSTGQMLSPSETFRPGGVYELSVHLASKELPINSNPTGRVNDSGINVICEQKGLAVANVVATFVAADSMAGNPFADVNKSDYFCDAVLWAVATGITKGSGARTFSPGVGCSRCQVVTFLWRTAGQPEPKSAKNPFTDVTEDDYYYKAVLWAVENGVTKGTGVTTFSPDATCTRGQIVSFLWRYHKCPEPAGSNDPFSDVTADDYYCKAVLWAVEKGVTKGTSAKAFSPNSTCTRAQVVTFIFRDILNSGL